MITIKNKSPKPGDKLRLGAGKSWENYDKTVSQATQQYKLLLESETAWQPRTDVYD